MKNLTVLLFSAVLLITIQSGFSLVLHQPGYESEIWLQLPCENLGRCMDFTFDDDGNIYTVHAFEGPLVGSVQVITPDKQIVPLRTDLVDPRKITWAGGTAYGDCLLVADRQKYNFGVRGEVTKITLDGQKSRFAWGLNQPNTLEIDRSGNYGGLLYIANSAHDEILTVGPGGGAASRFSAYPYGASGSMGQLAFDSMGYYGGLMFIAAGYTNLNYSGLFTMDSGGNPTQYLDAVEVASSVVFDTTPQGSFSGNMFISQRTLAKSKNTIMSVSDSSELTEFAFCNISAWWCVPRFHFTPEGSMYVMEYDPAKKLAVFTKITPTPWRRTVNNIQIAIQHDMNAIEEITRSLDAKYKALEDAMEILDTIDDEPYLSKASVKTSIARLKNAIQREENAREDLLYSVEQLQEVLELLNGSE